MNTKKTASQKRVMAVLCVTAVVFASLIATRSVRRGRLPFVRQALEQIARNLRISEAKRVHRFDEYEKATAHERLIPIDWSPELGPCDGITNYVSLGPTLTRRSFRGRDGRRWIDVTIDIFDSSHRAHEHLITVLATKPRGGIIATDLEGDATRLIGLRCMRWAAEGIWERGDHAEGVAFLRNNCLVRIEGRNTHIESLAREVDRQILVISGPSKAIP